MQQKEALVKFIEKSYLNKTIESLVLEAENETVSTHFKIDGFVGNVELNNFDLGEGEIGVYYPDVLLKILSILDNEINIEVKEKDSKVNSLKFKDKKGKTATYAAMDIDLIERSDKKKSKITDYEVKINLNVELIDDFLKAKSVIEGDAVNFLYEKDKLFIVFGHSKNNTNQIKFEVETEKLEDIDIIPFNGKLLQSIFSINSKKFKIGTLEINTKGLMRIYFEDENTKAEYFLIKLTDNSAE